jgi:hypothetical protein
MNTVEREARMRITVDGQEYAVPLLERGCDGCLSLSANEVLADTKPVYKHRELESVEEVFREVAWCDLFGEAVEGGPCGTCLDLRSRR